MRIIKPVTYSLLVIFWLTLIFSTVNAFANTTQTNVSGANSSTSITGGYESATTYQSGSSSNSTTNSTSTSNIKSAPFTASAPSMNVTTNCLVPISGGLQTFSIGLSGGSAKNSRTCEVIELAKMLSHLKMNVASIALLCNFSEEIWTAMYHAQTYCPTPEGFIGAKAKLTIDTKYEGKMPTYTRYLELEKKKKKSHKKSTLIHNDKKN